MKLPFIEIKLKIPDKSQKVAVRSSRPEVFCKKGVLRNFAKFTEKHLCQGLFFNFIKKETMAQVFSCEFYEISKNTFFNRTPLLAASEQSALLNSRLEQIWLFVLGRIVYCAKENKVFKDFFSKCVQNIRKLWICFYLLKKTLSKKRSLKSETLKSINYRPKVELRKK